MIYITGTMPTYTTEANGNCDAIFVKDDAVDARSSQARLASHTVTVGSSLAPSNINLPFTHTVRKPAQIKTLRNAVPNGLTGRITNIPKNKYDMLTRYGVHCDSVNTGVNLINTSFVACAGSESLDTDRIQAALDLHIAWLVDNSNAIVEMLASGSIASGDFVA